MEKKIIGFTCGSFDLLHAGHVLMLEECKSVCDYLVVGLQTDPSLDRPRKNSPVQSLEERRIQLSAIRYVDEVLVYETEKDLVKMLIEVQPDLRILGADWEGKDYTGCALPIECYCLHQTLLLVQQVPLLVSHSQRHVLMQR